MDDDWKIPSYTINFLGQNRVNQLKTIWTSKILLKNEFNSEILDFMVKKKKNILGKEKQEIREFIKKKNKKVTEKEIDDVFESIDNIVKSGHSLILNCQNCNKGILSLQNWFYEPYGDPKTKNIIYMNEESVLTLAVRKDNTTCQWCKRKIFFFNVYEVKKNYSVNHYYTYKKK